MIKGLVKPRWLFAGAAVGFLLCCILGRAASRHDFYKNFVRFNPFLNAAGDYYPTIDQMRQIAFAQCPRDKILVIVGGDSIFHGCGQPDDKLWTKTLQRDLGDRYRVINFAFPGSPPPGPGIMAAQSLLQSYPKVIFCCNIMATDLQQLPEDRWYRYLFWDAYYKGRAAISPARLAAAYATMHDRDRDKADASVKARASTQFDSWFYFRDLWDFVGYRWCFTIWNGETSLRKLNLFRPRKDCIYGYVPVSFEEREKEWEAKTPVYQDFMRKQGEHFRALVTKDSAGNWVENNADGWGSFDRAIELSIPEELRQHTLVAHLPINPWVTQRFVDKYTQDCLLGVEELAIKHFEAVGCSAVRCDDLIPSDYMDNGHLVSQGGDRVAGEVAAATQSLAARLGYLNGEGKSTP